MQGLRAIAVLVVVVFHSGLPLSGGFVGVDVFFVISGFVITSMLVRELTRTGRISFAAFYARRVRRLLPALAVVLVVVAAGTAVFLSPTGSQQEGAKTGLAASWFVANAEIYRNTGGYFDAAAETNPLLHMWTLAVEEQFYLVFPALLLLAWWAARRSGRRPRRTTAVVAAVAVLGSFALSLLLSYGSPAMRELAFYSSPTRAWEFGVGALLALAGSRLGRLGPRWSGAAGVLGAAVLLASFALLDGQRPFPGLAALAPVAGTALVIGAGTLGTPGVTRTLSVPWLVRVGDVSYSWYLWHWPLIVFAASLWPGSTLAATAAAAVSLLPAWWSFHRIEEPIRSDRRVVGRQAVRVAAVCVAVPSVLLVGLYVGSQHDWGSARLASMSEQVKALPAALPRGCQVGLHAPALGDWAQQRCTWGASRSGAPVYLVGDSNAGMLTEAVTGAARGLGRPVTVRVRSGCPFFDSELLRDGEPQRDCRRFVSSTIDWLTRQPQGTVVVATATDRYVDSVRYPSLPVWTVRDPESGAVLRAPAAKAAVYSDGLVGSIARMRAAGHRVVVVRTVPHFTGWDPRGCPMARALLSRCGVDRPVEQVKVEQQAARSAELRAATVAGADVLDLRPLLCPRGTCSTDAGGEWVYRDGTHISVRQSRALVPDVEAVLTGRSSRGA